MKSEAGLARERAGLSLEQAARRARIGPAYLRNIECQGGAGYYLAQRLSAVYQCRIEIFLYGPMPAGSGGRGIDRSALQRNRCHRKRS